MALTLVEAAKRAQMDGDVHRAAIIELYAMNSDVLAALPFSDIAGNALKYDLEEALPGIGFRGVNEGYTESTGVINPQMEPLVIAGGDLDVDMFITRTMGSGHRASQEAMKVKALAHTWGNKIIKGDAQTNLKEFDGLQVRLTGNQLIDAGATSGGDALSLAKLDELIDAVDNPTHLMCSKSIRRRLTTAARDTSVGGYITYDKDAFGRRVTKYNDLPLLMADENDQVFATLAYNEANPGGGSNVGTSIYCLSLTEGKLQGIQNGGMDVRDLGELEDKPVERTRVEWYAGLAFFHPRAAARLQGIKDAAVVV
jgi:hypothetical protein